MEQHGCGFIRSTSMKGNRLIHETLIDPERLEKLGQQQLLADLRAGKDVSVSVGAFVKTNGKKSSWNNKAYEGEWTEIGPDHTALLHGGVGACSIEQGCSANRAAMRVMEDGNLQLETLRDIPQSERDEMSASDFAGPDESFPIKTQADVDAAKRLIGKAANPDAVKAKIIFIAKRKGLTVPAAWQARGASMKLKELKAKMLALFDTPEQAASEEAAELIAYRSMRTMLDAAGDQWDEASQLVDDLISDEEDDPTETPAAEDAEEEVEDARLDAIRMLCYSMASALNNIVSVTYKQQQPDLPPVSDPRYAEQLKALIGKAISAKNMGTIQKAHDSSHDMHASTVALGAQCNGMKLLEAADESLEEFRAASGNHESAACGCDGGNMTNSEWIKETAKHGVSEAQVKGLEMLLDKDGKSAAIDAMRTLAAKAPADAIIQAKAAADAALAGHAHGLNAMDAADAAKKKAKDDAAAAKAKEDAADGGADDDKEDASGKKIKAAAAKAGISVEEYEEQEFLKTAPASIRAMAAKHKAAEAARKTELVAALKGGPLDEKQLAAKSVEDLETLAAYAKVETVDFSGRGLPRSAEERRDNTPPNPYSQENIDKRFKTVN